MRLRICLNIYRKMIAKIKNISGSPGLSFSLDYQFDKLEKEKGTILINNVALFSEDISKQECLDIMNGIVGTNDKIRSNFGYDISLNLPIGETVSDEKFKSIAMDYLKGMGYDNTAYIVFKHSDKEHSHIHILLPSVDYEGNKLDDSNNFYRSQKLTRSLEIKYDLIYTDYNKAVTNDSLNSINARKYYYHTALKKGLSAYSTKPAIEQILSADQIKYLKKNTLDNTAIAEYLGAEKDEKLRSVLTENKHFSTLYKDELSKKLDHFLKTSGTVNEYLQKLDNNEIYVRKVCKRGKMSFVYGLTADNMYFDDKTLSARFRYDKLVEKGQQLPGIGMERDSQGEYIKHKAVQCLASSHSIADLNTKLHKHDIELILIQDRGGVKEAKFKIGNDGNAEIFSGEELSGNLKYENMLSYLNNRVNSAAVSDYQTIQPEAVRPDFIMPYIPESAKKSRDDEDEQKPQKKKGMKK